MSPVDIDDALKAGHWVDFERDMQLCAWVTAVDARNVQSVVHVLLVFLLFLLDVADHRLICDEPSIAWAGGMV